MGTRVCAWIGACIGCGMVLLIWTHARAAEYHWKDVQGTWQDPSNWVEGIVPQQYDTTIVDQGEARIESDDANAYELYIGQQGTGVGRVSLKNKTLNLRTWGGEDFLWACTVGGDGWGSFTHQSGTLSCYGLVIGARGQGNGTYVIKSGATLGVVHQLALGGEDDGSSGATQGTLVIDGGSIRVGWGGGTEEKRRMRVGRSGYGDVTQTGGVLEASYLHIGGADGPTGRGVYRLQGGSILTGWGLGTDAGDLIVGEYGIGRLEQRRRIFKLGMGDHRGRHAIARDLPANRRQREDRGVGAGGLGRGRMVSCRLRGECWRVTLVLGIGGRGLSNSRGATCTRVGRHW